MIRKITMASHWQLDNVTIVDFDDYRQHRTVEIQDGKFTNIYPTNNKRSSTVAPSISIDAKDYYAYPGLINGFDNFLACYYKFDSENRPYRNWLAHDNDLKSSDLFRQKMMIDSEDLYLLGSLRSVFSGVITVVDHIPHNVHRPFHEIVFPKILANFAINHSVGHYHLNWGSTPQREYEYAMRNKIPYIVRVGEGSDAQSVGEVAKLQEIQVLGKNTILIHAMNINDEEIETIASSGAHVVWVPESQEYLYAKQTPIEKCLAAGVSVFLGSGSAMNGATNFFSAMRFAVETLKKKSELKNEHLAKMVFTMATRNAAFALQIKNRGQILANKSADFFLLAKKMPDPYETLIASQPHDIQLLCIDGIPVIAQDAFASIAHMYADNQYETFSSSAKDHRKIQLRIPMNDKKRYSLSKILLRTGHYMRPFPFLGVSHV